MLSGLSNASDRPAEERRAVVAAEPLLAALVWSPDAKPVLAGDDPERAVHGVRIRRCRRSAATLAALAVAIARYHGRRGHLEPDGPAVAAAGEREVRHLRWFLSLSRPEAVTLRARSPTIRSAREATRRQRRPRRCRNAQRLSTTRVQSTLPPTAGIAAVLPRITVARTCEHDQARDRARAHSRSRNTGHEIGRRRPGRRWRFRSAHS